MTAIEWLEKEIKNEDHYTEGELGNSCIDVNTLLTLIKQAKRTEKEQKIEFAKRYAKRCQAPMVDSKWLEENS